MVGFELKPLPSTPPGPMLTRVVCPFKRSRTKTSSWMFVSPGTRFVANEENAMNRPSALIEGEKAPKFASAPSFVTLTRLVMPVVMSRTKTSWSLLVSLRTRFVHVDANATKRPSDEMAGDELAPPKHCEPPLVTLARVVWPAVRSRTKMSKLPFVSSGTSAASDVNATNRPSPLMADSMLIPLACAPPAATLTREVCLAPRSRTKMSVAPLVSPATRFAASEAKVTKRPSALIFGPELRALP